MQIVVPFVSILRRKNIITEKSHHLDESLDKKGYNIIYKSVFRLHLIFKTEKSSHQIEFLCYIKCRNADKFVKGNFNYIMTGSINISKKFFQIYN